MTFSDLDRDRRQHFRDMDAAIQNLKRDNRRRQGHEPDVTEEELKIAAMMGVSRAELIAQKKKDEEAATAASDAGTTLTVEERQVAAQVGVTEEQLTEQKKRDAIANRGG